MGFVRPLLPGEMRVALLPEHVDSCFGEVVIESGYGSSLGIDDSTYSSRGAQIASRGEIFESCDYVYSLKILQPSDHSLLRKGQTIIGWTHPETHGKDFFNTVCREKEIKIIDLDNRHPSLFFGQHKVPLRSIRSGFLDQNSKNAGFASVHHAFASLGLLPWDVGPVAVLAAGSVSQGSLSYLNRMGHHTDLYTRSTMGLFLERIGSYNVVVSGIDSLTTVVSRDDLAKMAEGSVIIDAAANVGGAIEGIRFTSIESPLYEEEGKHFYCVPNSPSLFFRSASATLSEAFATEIYPQDPGQWLALL
jgi:N5-(carboxyethyl)ornithine synthase